MMPTHDVIDNRTHFAVGYFFLSGFQATAGHIPHLDQLRLRIGNVTNRQTIEQLAEGYHDPELFGEQRMRAAIRLSVFYPLLSYELAPEINALLADGIRAHFE